MYQTGNDGPHQPGAYGNQRHLRQAHAPHAAFGGESRQHSVPQPSPQAAPRQGMQPQYQAAHGQHHHNPTPNTAPTRVATLTHQHFQNKDTLSGNLLNLTATAEPIFVMFHTDNCGVCQQVMPLYHQIAQQLPFQFASCNLTRNPQVLTMSEPTRSPITHVPRLYLYSKGWPYMVYKDMWQAEKLTQFMKVSWQRAGELQNQSQNQSQNQNQNQSQSQNHQTQLNPSQRTAGAQFNPHQHPIPQLQRNSQYAQVNAPQGPTQLSCNGEDCGDLLSFNEVLCDSSHGCYTVIDAPHN